MNNKTYISPNKFISYNMILKNINNEDEIIFYDHLLYNYLEDKFKTGKLNIKNKRILDLGSNIGSYCFLSEKYGGISTGVECNIELYNISNIIKDKIKSNVKFINADINNYDIKNKYDIIYLFDGPLGKNDLLKTINRLLVKLLLSNAKYFYLIGTYNMLEKYFTNIYHLAYIEKIDSEIYFKIYKKNKSR